MLFGASFFLSFDPWASRMRGGGHSVAKAARRRLPPCSKLLPFSRLRRLTVVRQVLARDGGIPACSALRLCSGAHPLPHRASVGSRWLPAELLLIILPFIRAGNADKELILCPIELRPQCGRIWVCARVRSERSERSPQRGCAAPVRVAISFLINAYLCLL